MTSRLFRGSMRLNFVLDVFLTVLFAIALEYRFTGLRLHELLGLAFGLAMLVHLILHLDWVWTITRTFFRRVIHESRLNYVFNVLLFIDAVILVLSGVLISRTLGLTFAPGRLIGLSWERLHILSAELSLILIALHVALHWKWIASAARNSFVAKASASRSSVNEASEA